MLPWTQNTRFQGLHNVRQYPHRYYVQRSTKAPQGEGAGASLWATHSPLSFCTYPIDV